MDGSGRVMGFGTWFWCWNGRKSLLGLRKSVTVIFLYFILFLRILLYFVVFCIYLNLCFFIYNFLKSNYISLWEEGRGQTLSILMSILMNPALVGEFKTYISFYACARVFENVPSSA